MWHRSFLYCLNEAKHRGLCLYSAGYWGGIALRLFSLFSVTPLCYCDDDESKIGKTFHNIPVLSLKDAAASYPNAVYIVCIDQTESYGLWGRVHQKKMLSSLKTYNVYDSNSELRLAFYLFLIDINGNEGIDDIKKQLPSRNTDEKFHWNNLKNLVVANNMSNSGVWFFIQLLDMHSHILCLPCCKTFENVYENRLQYLEGDELIIEMAAQALGYFKSEFEELECVGQHKFENFCLDKEGQNIKNAYIEPTEFLSNLYLQFPKNNIKLSSYSKMLKIYFASYNNCLQRKYDPNINYWMMYDMHLPNYDIRNEYNYLSANEFNRIEHIILIREPVQHCFSWISRAIIHSGNNTAAKKEFISDIIKSELGINIERKNNFDNLHIIKFEDIKYNGISTLKAFCDFLQIPFEETMLQTTLNGIEVYFPARTKEGLKYISGFDTAAVQKKDFSEILTPWDEVRLNIIYAMFKKALGYTTKYPSFCEFKDETIEDILKEDFKFATIIQKMVDEHLEKSEQYDVNNFIRELFTDYIKQYNRESVSYYDCICAKETTSVQ